jgi:PKD repeat protein
VAGPTTQSILASASGSYTVTVKNTSLQCQATSNPVTVTANPSPVAKFSFPASFVLFTPATFTDQSTGATSWLWDFGDGLTSNLQNPTHTYNAISNPTVKLTVTSSNGCKNSVSNSISVITAVEDLATAIVAYPNPVNGQLLTVEIPAASKASGVSLLNTFGQVLFDQAIAASVENQIIQIPVLVFPTGVYFIQVKTKDGLSTKKISSTFIKTSNK